MQLSAFEAEMQEGELEVTIRHLLNVVSKDGEYEGYYYCHSFKR